MNRIMTAIGIFVFGLCAVIAPEINSVKTIPLSSVITTGPQPEAKAFEVAFPDEAERRKLVEQISAFSGGASNLFLVDATNSLDAFEATLSVLQGSHSAETPAPVNTAEPQRGSYWLVAYLGVGPSQPVSWIVESATIDRNTIRVSYHHPKANIVTRDVWRFYYWVPLGKLAAGNYQLELYDTREKAVTLSRRVRIDRGGVRRE
jgi:hypothetical protein